MPCPVSNTRALMQTEYFATADGLVTQVGTEVGVVMEKIGEVFISHPHADAEIAHAILYLRPKSALGNVAEHLASHFVSAEIRHFSAGELEAAKEWIMNRF
jgi:hypothetical protein